MNSKIIIVGSGGREYAIIKKLKKDSIKLNLQYKLDFICFTSNTNDMINEYFDELYDVSNEELPNKIQDVINSYKDIGNNILFSIIGPENYLLDGLADLFESNNIPCIGPLKIYAQIETSKSFCLDFLNKYEDLSPYLPLYTVINEFDISNFDRRILKNFSNEIDLVIKKDGLYKGKGVFVQGVDFDKPNELTYSSIDKNIKVVIEEKLIGDEFSLMSLTDGNSNIRHFPPIQDYKRLLNGDIGPNTGGMGCFIDKNNTLPFLNNFDISVAKSLNERVIYNINEEGKYYEKIGYRGILYGSYIKTKDGIKIIEYNSRFGDPECIVALELLQTNFLQICSEISYGLLITELVFSKKACICVYLVPKNYSQQDIDPYKSKNNKYDIYFNENDNLNTTSDCLCYSNIEILNDHNYSLSSRTMAITECNDTLYKCYHTIYNKIKDINGNLFYRTDIGKKYLSNYESYGVSIQESNESLESIKKDILSTYNSNVISEYGSFGGEYKMNQHTLISSIDGVGTKVVLSKKILGEVGFKNLGLDIVGHSVNDILVQGGNPLFFLDYYGTNCLNKNELKYFINGVSEGCKLYDNFPILGGETAEMPLVYRNNCVDLVGCIIGLKNNSFFKNSIQRGDLIVNIPSNGPHTNGFTLINNIVDNTTDKDILDSLLTPHRCYLREVREFVEKFGYDVLHGMCHITGGGIYDNLDRIIPKNCNLHYEINIDQSKFPIWCKYLMDVGCININEMLNVFNCGFGYLLIIDKNIVPQLELSYSFDIIGQIV